MQPKNKLQSYDAELHRAFKLYKACVWSTRLLDERQKLMLKIEFGIGE